MLDVRKKLEEEIAALEYELRNELPKEILKARAHGDLSENAEYHAAKERQGFVNARLGQLKKRMGEVAMIDVNKIPRDRVGLGSRVVILDISKDEEISYHLVTSEDADVAQGRVSTSSPIGKSLLGKEVGDMVKLVTPGGTRDLEILSLRTIHEFIVSADSPADSSAGNGADSDSGEPRRS
jgi:transcription elongation factor GreA